MNECFCSRGGGVGRRRAMLHRWKKDFLVSMFTCAVQSNYGYSSIRPFNWATVLVPVYKR